MNDNKVVNSIKLCFFTLVICRHTVTETVLLTVGFACFRIYRIQKLNNVLVLVIRNPKGICACFGTGGQADRGKQNETHQKTEDSFDVHRG